MVVVSTSDWSLLQTVAWTSMLAGNLRHQTFQSAVSRTFSGQYPCPLCRAIAMAKKAGQKNAVLNSTQKMEFPPIQKGLWLFHPLGFQAVAGRLAAIAELRPKPPLPPPRLIAL